MKFSIEISEPNDKGEVSVTGQVDDQTLDRLCPNVREAAWHASRVLDTWAKNLRHIAGVPSK